MIRKRNSKKTQTDLEADTMTDMEDEQLKMKEKRERHKEGK